MSADRRPAIRPPAALQGAVVREVRIAEQTRPLRAALKQTEHYTDLRGVPYPLTQMSGAEALLVLALVERHAEVLHRGELGEQLLVAAAREGRERQQAIEAHDQLASLTAAGWLRATPLHRALTERASQ